MRRGILAFAGVCTAAGILAAPAPNVLPAKVVTFKDWTVGCDNGLACQAVALMPQTMPDGALSVVVTRAEGAAALLAIEMSGLTSKSDRFRIVIDGKVAYAGEMQAGSEMMKVSALDAIKLARTMAKGRVMTVIDGAGTDLGTASLSGASAAFRYADAAQGRAGSRGAIIATGAKKSNGKTSSLPVIIAKKIKPTDILPDTAAIVALSENSPCATERYGPTQDAAYSLGTDASGPQALILLNCGSGAYNFSVGVYVGLRDANGKWAFAPAKFDYTPTRFAEGSDLALVVNADWDANTQSLSGYSKGRGIGDCGSSESYVWDGSMFRLTSATLMDQCRGSLDWIPVWRATVKLTG